MNTIKYIFIFISLFFISHFIKAQNIKQFSDEPAIFAQQFQEFMSLNITENNKLILDRFIIKIKSDTVFSEEEKTNIITICNLMLKSKAIPYPHFKEYIVNIMKFKKSGRDLTEYVSWEKGIESILRKNMTLTKLNSMFEHTRLLLDSNVLYKSASTEWKTYSDDYKFKFDNGPIIVFNKMDLYCFSKRDSMKIYNTQGIMYPLENSWSGKYGEVTWERTNLERDQVHANLTNYKINLTRSDYKADTVTFTHKSFLKKPLIGKFEDKVMNVVGEDDYLYPKFESYANEFEIKNLYKGVDFKGGFLFSGSKIIGKGNQDGMASLTFTRSDTILIRAKSNYFVIKKTAIKGLNTLATVYLGNDSIYHPDLTFDYLAEKRELLLKRTDDITSKAPYYNSYHKIGMDFETFFWQIDEPFIYLTMMKGSAEGTAEFESENYFSKERYEGMMGRADQHPLVIVWKYSKEIKSETFNAVDLANYMALSISQTRHFLMYLASKGFIYLNTETDEVIIRKKLYDYLEASMGKKDYDVINFTSNTKAPLENAFLNIQNMDLVVNGMPFVQVSNVQNVQLLPRGQQITIKRNRDFQFDGKVVAGLFSFYGNNFYFDYDSFKITLNNVDSLKIKVKIGTDNYGKPIYDNVRSIIENVTGNLFIDKQNNKSGVKDFPQYPIFESRKPSYVYYDKTGISKGKYPRGDFYFKIDPYTIDSLDNFSKEAMEFDGVLSSSGIFPEFRQKLKLQMDMSLGFLQKAPPEGYPTYGGKGTYYNDIELSNKGLHGKGKIDYLTSTTYSDDFFFFPDSMLSDANDFKNQKQTSGIEYPMVECKNIYVRWLPKQDKMYISNKENWFKIIDDKNALTGRLLLTPSGMSGKGKMDLTTAEMYSLDYKYRSNGFSADTADFNLKSLKSTNFTVLTKNINADIDYNKREGIFRSNEDFTMVQFPENKYISYLDYFVWEMDKQEFKMGAKKKYKDKELNIYSSDTLIGPRYISVKHGQDSLNFMSPQATYDYRNNLIKANDVQFIKVADSRIFPKEGKVVIEAEAMMQPLKESKVLSNDVSKYHQFYNAEINIWGRKNYTGFGDHDYIDENKKKQIIHFKTIRVDSLITNALGEIIEPDSFTLSPYFFFQGKVKLKADNEFMIFDGATRIVTDCNNMGTKWLNFETTIYPDSIYIPINNEPIDIDRRPLYAGLMLCQDSVHLYPTYLSSRKFYADEYISTASGYLHYNKNQVKYEIAKAEKLLGDTAQGNYISLFTNPCTYYGEGKINLGVDFWQVKTTSVGNVYHNFDSNDYKFNLLMGIDYFMDNNILKLMTTHIDSLTKIKGQAVVTDQYVKQIKELLYQNNISKYSADAVLFDSIQKWPNEIAHTLLLNHLYLNWNQKTKSYQSFGKIGIAAIQNTPINLWVDGYMEIQKKRNRDYLDLYLRINPNDWYYFHYADGVFYTISSNIQYNNTINELKISKRKLKVKRGEKPYIYMLSSADQLPRFLNRVNKYFNKKNIEGEEIIDETILEDNNQILLEEEETTPKKKKKNKLSEEEL